MQHAEDAPMPNRNVIEYGTGANRPRKRSDWWSWFCLSLIPGSFFLLWGAGRLLGWLWTD
jgi:hypothetical protein